MGVSIKGVNISKDLLKAPKTFDDVALGDDAGLTQVDRITRQDVIESTVSELDKESSGISGNSGATSQLSAAYTNEMEADPQGLNASKISGVESLFNPMVVFVHPKARNKNDFFDSPDGSVYPKYLKSTGNGKGTGNRNVSWESLLEDFKPSLTPSTPYKPADFLYAKYFRTIPLNRLITLRRFLFPTFDNLTWGANKDTGLSKIPSPIAQAVTYFGDPTENKLVDFTRYSGNIAWEQLTADVWDIDGNEQGASSTPFGKVGEFVAKGTGTLNGQSDLSGIRKDQIEYTRKYQNFEWQNQEIGPVNVINQTNVRKRGIGANYEASVVFEYQLKSYNNINPRVAMLDLMCNMLALSFNHARFWGGTNRYFPNSPQFPFLGDQRAFYRGDYKGYLNSVVGQVGSAVKNGFNILGNLISNILNLNFEGLMQSASKGASIMFDMQARKNRPNLIGFHALLTGAPVGEWHLTVGNPYRPITSIGNLICEGFDMEFDGALGVDDFPTEFKFVINLKSGRPRDAGDIQSVFNMGQGRMYYPPTGLIDVNQSTSTQNNAGNVKIPANPYVGRQDIDLDYVKRLYGTIF